MEDDLTGAGVSHLSTRPSPKKTVKAHDGYLTTRLRASPVLGLSGHTSPSGSRGRSSQYVPRPMLDTTPRGNCPTTSKNSPKQRHAHSPPFNGIEEGKENRPRRRYTNATDPLDNSRRPSCGCWEGESDPPSAGQEELQAKQMLMQVKEECAKDKATMAHNVRQIKELQQRLDQVRQRHDKEMRGLRLDLESTRQALADQLKTCKELRLLTQDQHELLNKTIPSLLCFVFAFVFVFVFRSVSVSVPLDTISI